MAEFKLTGLDRLYAKEIVKLWSNPEDRKQMMETGVTEQQILELKEKYSID